jgi:hypothetical protein
MLLDLFLACSGGTSDAPAGDDTTSSAPDDSDSTPTKPHYDCTPLDQNGPDGKSAPSGYEWCAVDATAGFMHRVKAVDVAVDPFDPDAICDDEAFEDECHSAADCEKGSACEPGTAMGCHCVPKCRTDADCGEGFACLPRMVSLGGKERVISGTNSCIGATCLTDADCPSGWCVLSSGCTSLIGGGLVCFSDKDECRTSAECPLGKDCYYHSSGWFQCDDYTVCE